VLFLGQLNLRKGAGRLFDAMLRMKDKPVEFWFVGPCSIKVPDAVCALRSFKYVGPVPRSQVHRYYEAADLFLLPSLSDGFALTQLEAQWFGLPIIASKNCGPVVIDRVNGLILAEVTAEAIQAAVDTFASDPAYLEALRLNAAVGFASLREYASHFIEKTCG
jgi:glycosyltransferase involved in cell wall biosynthesis